jgi:hypothetical protein
MQISYDFRAGLCRLVQARKPVLSIPMGITQETQKKLRP